MKKLVVLVCVAFMGIVSTNAQIVWGARVGACYSTAYAAGDESISGKAGLEIGPVLYYIIAKSNRPTI